MSAYKTIVYEIDPNNRAVCRITMNRPDKKNCIDRKMAVELIDAFRKTREEESITVVVLGGAGGTFCSGGDLSIFPSLADHRAGLNWLAHEGLDIQRAIADCEAVVICRIEGHCLAGGLELALACDLLYAKESAKLGITEINMGALPGWGGTTRIVRSIPVFQAREIIYSGRRDYSAREMYDKGLLTRVFSDDEFDKEFEGIVANIGSKSPIAIRMGKEVMARSFEGCSVETMLALERNSIQWLTNSPEVQSVFAKFKEAPDGFTKAQKASTEKTDTGKSH